jgi:hypothetical protein
MLDERVHDICPQIIRLWWERMDLKGHLSGVDFGWAPDAGFEASMVVEDVELTLPIETDEMWARYRGGVIESAQGRPRMHVNSGTIKITENSAELVDLRGELSSTERGDMVGVPYDVSVTIGDLPELDWDDRERWLDEALEHAAFNMRFRADEFRVRREEHRDPPAVELPLPVARVLEKFRFSDWVMSTAVEVWRDPPVRDGTGMAKAQPIESRGQAYITDGSGTYEKFRYPLGNVEAYLEFETDKVTVHYVTGDGSDGAKVRISGSIAPLTHDAQVALQLAATDVPFDDALRGALHEDHQSIFDALLHHESYRALQEAGRLPTEGMLDALRHEVEALEGVLEDARERAESASGDDAEHARAHVARLEADVLRRRTIIDAGLFAPGGRVDLDLHIAREAGEDQPTRTTGSMRFDRFGLVYERFPYPMHVASGRLEWQEDRVVLVGGEPHGGVSVVTPGGGRGELHGEIVVVQEGDRVRAVPDLELDVRGDQVSGLLYASIPLTTDERDDPDLVAGWPGEVVSRGGRLLGDLDLTGRLDYVASVGTDEQGEVDYDVRITLSDGRALPAAALREFVRTAGSFDPDEWKIEECSGTLRVSRDMIELQDLTGRVDRGTLTLRGQVDLRTDPLELRVEAEIREMPFGETLLGVVPEKHRIQADELWERYRPEGVFDADLVYLARGGTTETLDLAVRPRSVDLRIDDRRVTLTRESGAIHVVPDRVRLDGLVVEIRSDGVSDGTIELNGDVGMTPDITGEGMRGSWTGGRFESPIVSEVVGQVAAGAHEERWRDWNPRGTFKGLFRYAPGAAEDADYELSIQPSTLTFVQNGDEISMEFEPGGAFEMTPGWIAFENLRCRRDGEILDLSGEIETGGPLAITLRLDFFGKLRGGPFEGVLPDVVRRALAGIDVREGKFTRVNGGRLSVLELPPGDDGRPRRYVEFTGRIVAHDAAIRTGVEISEIDGPIDLHVTTSPERPPRTEIVARPHRATLFGQQLNGIDVDVLIEGRDVTLNGFSANAREGVMGAEGFARLEEGGRYQVSAQFVGVPIGDFNVSVPEGADEDPTGGKDSDGRVYARFDVAGERGDMGSRTGRGVARVLGGPLTEVPLMLHFLQLFHLAVPGEWEFADAEFFIAGDRLVFEEILFESTILDNVAQQLVGHGELNLETWEMDARLNTRGGLFLIRDVVGAVGDQLGAIHVTGTLWEPVPALVPLPTLIGPKALAGTAPRIRRREEASP